MAQRLTSNTVAEVLAQASLEGPAAVTLWGASRPGCAGHLRMRSGRRQKDLFRVQDWTWRTALKGPGKRFAEKSLAPETAGMLGLRGGFVT
jgi:hypothetical protein